MPTSYAFGEGNEEAPTPTLPRSCSLGSLRIGSRISALSRRCSVQLGYRGSLSCKQPEEDKKEETIEEMAKTISENKTAFSALKKQLSASGITTQAAAKEALNSMFETRKSASNSDFIAETKLKEAKTQGPEPQRRGRAEKDHFCWNDASKVDSKEKGFGAKQLQKIGSLFNRSSSSLNETDADETPIYRRKSGFVTKNIPDDIMLAALKPLNDEMKNKNDALSTRDTRSSSAWMLDESAIHSIREFDSDAKSLVVTNDTMV